MSEATREERIKFLKERAKSTVKNGVAVSYISGGYRDYMKKFFGITPEMLRDLSTAKRALTNDLIAMAGEELIENKGLEKAATSIRTEFGSIKARFEREKTFNNPQTGTRFTKPYCSVTVRVRSYMDKELLSSIEEKIRNAAG